MMQKTTLEVIAQTVEEAIENGLAQLSIPREAADVEILDTGSKGFLGLGGRQARVRLTLRDNSVSPVMPARKETPAAVGETPTPVVEVVEDEATQLALKVSKQVVRELLDKMQIKADVITKSMPPVDEKDQSVILVEIQGNDLSILIGRRSEVLNALQYIASLIVSKEIGHWVPMLIDVQGYRTRRDRQLRMLARRMAEQVIHTGKREVLEPMPPSERRIIHLELRGHPDVDTESIGEEPYRKVTIVPKKS